MKKFFKTAWEVIKSVQEARARAILAGKVWL